MAISQGLDTAETPDSLSTIELENKRTPPSEEVMPGRPRL